MVAPGVFLDTLNILVTAPLDDCSNIKNHFGELSTLMLLLQGVPPFIHVLICRFLLDGNALVTKSVSWRINPR